MKLTATLLLVVALQVSAGSRAQKVTLDLRNATMEKFFKEIRKQTGFAFFYEKSVMQKMGTISVQVKDMDVEQVLRKSFADRALEFEIIDKTIVIRTKIVTVAEPVKRSELFFPIKGSVKDDKGSPISGASILVKGTQRGTSTSEQGTFSIDATEGEVLEITAVGFAKQSITVKNESTINITMVLEIISASEVVVVGYGTQRRVSMTSAVTQVKGEDLVRRPVSNLQQALQGQAPGLTVLDSG